MSSPATRTGQVLSAGLAGLVFGIGLVVSGMSDPAKVKGFLELGGRWDPSLAFVMVGAIGVGLAGQWLATHLRNKGRSSFFGQAYPKPKPPLCDRRLVLGSLAFGTGWGLVGICPGPAVVLTGLADPRGLIFLAAMIAGMLVHALIQRSKSPH